MQYLVIKTFQLVNNTLDFGNGACGLTEPYSRVIKISWPTRTVQIYWWSRLATSWIFPNKNCLCRSNQFSFPDIPSLWLHMTTLSRLSLWDQIAINLKKHSIKVLFQGPVWTATLLTLLAFSAIMGIIHWLYGREPFVIQVWHDTSVCTSHSESNPIHNRLAMALTDSTTQGLTFCFSPYSLFKKMIQLIGLGNTLQVQKK